MMRNMCHIVAMMASMAYLLPLAARSEELPPRVLQAKDRFGYALNEMVTRRSTEQDRLNMMYARSLTDLETAVRSEGDLAATTAVRAEIERFRQAKTVSVDHIVVTSERLAGLQRAYINSLSAPPLLGIAQEILQLTDRYSHGLEQAKRDMVRAGDLPAATAVYKEIERVQEHPDRLHALNTVKAVHTADPVVTASEGISRETASRQDGVYPLGREPAFDGAERIVRHTKYSRSVAHRGRLTIAVREVSHVGTDYRGRNFRLLSGTFAHFPRLTFRPSPRDPIRGGTAVFQYYAIPLSESGRTTLMRTELIPFTAFDHSDGIVIDGSGVRYGMREYRPRNAGQSRGHKHVGIVISLYDPSGALITQGADDLALVDEGEQTLPEPRNDNRGQEFHAGLHDIL